jgi:ferric-dicitrate binding protein FerR (iron transport regulator)
MSEPTDGREILELWPGASPPAGFADRALAAATRVPRRRPRWQKLAAIGAAAVALAAVALVLLAGDRTPPARSGARVTTDRETVTIGDRAVLVAEPDAAIAWRVRAGAAEVDQRRGSVFYRVDRTGEPFVVITPAGRIRVRGTCFRVEVRTMKRELIAAGGGAALAALVTVVVYEGAVVADNSAGHAEATAGDTISLRPGEAPTTAGGTAAALPGPAPATASPADLRARETVYLREIAALRQRVAELERDAAGRDRPAEDGQPPRDKFHDFTRDELQWMARECQIRYDIPGYAMELGIELDRAEAGKLGISEDERAGINRIFADGDPQMLEQMRDLYVELTGNREVAEALSPRNLQHEIFEKSRPQDLHRAFQRLSAERAGLREPPADLRELPPVERLLRLLVRTGDRYQERLAEVVGADRAEQLRRSAAGMGRRRQSGCPDATTP